MRNRLKRIAYLLTAAFFVFTYAEPTVVLAAAKNDEMMDDYSHNNIMFYNRECGSGISGACGGDITSEGVEERLREVVEKYGEIAMKMQIEYGPPWELVFGQMVMESGVGSSSNGVDASVKANGYFNWLGMMFGSNHFYNLPDAYHSPNGRSWSQYSSIGNMIAAWMVDYLRNGYYDSAFKYTDPNNYDIEKFFFEMIQSYCPASDGCDHQAYWETVSWGIKIADEVAKQKGWPTSAELARQENIPIGGNYPVNGDIHKQIDAEPHSLSVDCTNDDSVVSDEESNVNVNGSQVTMIGDSISVMSQNELKNTIKGVDLDAKSGTWFARDDPQFGASGTSRLRAKGSSIRDIVVFAMGTNGGLTQSEVDELISITGTKRKVVLMTEYIVGGESQAQQRNAEVKKAASRYDNIVIADWYAAVKNDPGAYIINGDNVHPSEKGKQLFANVIAKGITKTGGADGSGKTTVDISWQDGWITGGMEGYVKESAEAADLAGTFHLEDSSHTGQFEGGKANKITLHYTAGTNQGGGGGLKLYGGGYPAHFTIDLQEKKVYQHFSINQPSDAVASHDKTAGIQIEIIGTEGDSLGKKWNLFDKESYGDNEWIYLATLLVGISSELGIPLTTDVDWENPTRLSSSDFAAYKGILAHMHVPDNDHTDTGNIWPMLSEALEKVGAGTGEDQCGNKRNTRIEGGLTLEEAQKLADYYKGPMDPAPYNLPFGKWNCVSMSAWFVQAFTDVGLASRAWGNGADVAAGLKEEFGWETGTEPQPWAIFSVTSGKTMCGSHLCGHTGVVVGVQGNTVITLEASYGDVGYAAAVERDISYFTNDKYGFVFAYMGDHFKADELQKLLDTL